MKIVESTFFNGYKEFFNSTLPQEQFDDLKFFIDKLNASEKISGTEWDVVRAKYAYVLATVYHETAYSFDPISEMGSRRYLMGKAYYPYYGRGYVQLTWKENYRKFGEFLGIDLVNNPYLANEPENAWLILEEGMTRNDSPQDPNFTRYTLDDVFTENSIADSLQLAFVKARKIINGLDKAQAIAEYAHKFYNIIDLE